MASIDQFQTFATNMKSYFSELNGHFSSGSTMPMFNDIVSKFDYSDILNDSVSVSKKSVTSAAGALADSVHSISAIVREFGIRSKARVDYFTDAVNDTDVESNYYDALNAHYGTLITGKLVDTK